MPSTGWLATTHLPAALTIPCAVLLAALGVWQLRRPTKAGTPPSRTRIRRASMMARIALLAPLVVGLSLVDPALRPATYVWTWGAATGLLALGVCFAAADVANNMRLRTRAQRALDQEVLAWEPEPEPEPDPWR
jgi:hypothetical protein